MTKISKSFSFRRGGKFSPIKWLEEEESKEKRKERKKEREKESRERERKKEKQREREKVRKKEDRVPSFRSTVDRGKREKIQLWTKRLN